MLSTPTATAPGALATPRSLALAGAGDGMASAFALLFALAPGLADAGATEAMPGTAALSGSDKRSAKPGNDEQQDGKSLPTDAALMAIMPPPVPLPLAEVPIPAETVAATHHSPAPITALLAALPTALPTLPDAPIASTGGTTPERTPGGDTAPLATSLPAAPAMTPVAPAPTIASPQAEAASVIPAPLRAEVAPSPIRMPMAAPASGPTPIDGTSPVTTAAPPAAETAPASLDQPPAMTADRMAQTIPLTRTIPAATTAPAIAAPAIDTGPPIREATIRVADTAEPRTARFAAAGQAAIAAPLPREAAAPMLQPGQTAPAIRLFAEAMRGDTAQRDDRTERTRDIAADPLATLALGRSDAVTPGTVAPVTGAQQAPLDMTAQHWPQGMIDRIERMREDAATADSRIQLSPDALGGIAVSIRRDAETTHIHFTAEQAQTATMLAEARPELARLAEEKGMRLGQTAVDLGQTSGGGGERQAPPRQPEPVKPTRPAFAGADSISDADMGPAAATTRIA